ncbi:hypothetical protein HY501_01605 [Candidatus Woesearchaeota archaeon]|nr:hypothetical protein [Candidatus Woesearchaeota archaeon]
MAILKRLGIAATAAFLSACSVREEPRLRPLPLEETLLAAEPAPSSKPAPAYTVEYEDYGGTRFIRFIKEGEPYALLRYDIKDAETKSKRCRLDYFPGDIRINIWDYFCDGISDRVDGSMLGDRDLSLGEAEKIKGVTEEEVADKAGRFLREFYAKHDVKKRIEEYSSKGKDVESYKKHVAAMHASLDKILKGVLRKEKDVEISNSPYSPDFTLMTRTISFSHYYSDDPRLVVCTFDLRFDPDEDPSYDFNARDYKCDGSVEELRLHVFEMDYPPINLLPKDRSAFEEKVERILGTFYKTYDIHGMISTLKKKVRDFELKRTDDTLDKAFRTL